MRRIHNSYKGGCVVICGGHGGGHKAKIKKGIQAISLNPFVFYWGERWDLNPRPPGPQPGDLTN